MVKWEKYERFHIFIGPYFLHFTVSAPCQQFLNAPMCTHQWLTELLRKVNCALLQKCTHPFRFVPFKPKEILLRGGGLIPCKFWACTFRKWDIFSNFVSFSQYLNFTCFNSNIKCKHFVSFVKGGLDMYPNHLCFVPCSKISCYSFITV